MDRVTDEFDGKYDADENTILTVLCRNGDIKISRYDGEKVDFHADISAIDQERMDQLDIVVTEEGGDISIGTEFEGTKDEPTVKMTIKVPWVVHIDSIKAFNGDVEARLDGSKGDAQVSSSNGNVEVTVKKGIAHNLTFSSSNGDVLVKIDPDEDLNVSASTSNGKVSVSGLDITYTVDQPKSKIGTMGSGGPVLTASTSNGNVELSKV
jgi:hypothetical protein